MRLVTVCDSQGTILALMSYEEGAPRLSLGTLPPGHQEIDIEVGDIIDTGDDSEIQRRMEELIQSHRVDMRSQSFVARNA